MFFRKILPSSSHWSSDSKCPESDTAWQWHGKAETQVSWLDPGENTVQHNHPHHHLLLALATWQVLCKRLACLISFSPHQAHVVMSFILLGSKITVDGDCSHEIKRCLLLRRKATDKPRQCIKKQNHFADKVLSSQSYFSCSHVKRWNAIIKKAENWKIDAFKPWYWRRFLRVP